MSGAPGFVRALALVARKDLAIEARARGAAATMVVFSLLVLFVFALAVPAPRGAAPGPPPHAAGVLWVSILFAAVIGAGRAYAIEADGGLDALRLSPADPAAVYLGKLTALLALLLGLEAVVVPAFLVVFGYAAGPGVLAFVAFAALGTVGIAAVACLLGAITSDLGGRDFVLPLLLLPLALPQLLALVRGTDLLLGGAALGDLGSWLVIVIAYDVAHLAAAAVLFELVLGGD